MSPVHTRSPFFARAYGGYTPGQEVFFRQQLDEPLGKCVLDPMAGYGHLLANLAVEGAEVVLCDINPAPLLLVGMRDIRHVRNRHRLYAWLSEVIHALPRPQTDAKFEYIDDWLAPSMRDGLCAYLHAAGVDLSASPFRYDGSFGSQSSEAVFAASLPILAARDIVCFRPSSNPTWSKPGGLLREHSCADALLRALNQWFAFAEEQAESDRMASTRHGSLTTRRLNVESDHLEIGGKPDIIVTSPPYANRLDYSRLWAPELELMSALWEDKGDHVRALQMGSTVVRGRKPSDSDLSKLPTATREKLDEVRADKTSTASASYYFPFFANYALSLASALRNMGAALSNDGVLVLFVRDTVRKDVLFSARDLIRGVLVDEGSFDECAAERKIIRSHVGLVRSQEGAGVYGLAQQEWWLVYRKG